MLGATPEAEDRSTSFGAITGEEVGVGDAEGAAEPGGGEGVASDCVAITSATGSGVIAASGVFDSKTEDIGVAVGTVSETLSGNTIREVFSGSGFGGMVGRTVSVGFGLGGSVGLAVGVLGGCGVAVTVGVSVTSGATTGSVAVDAWLSFPPELPSQNATATTSNTIASSPTTANGSRRRGQLPMRSGFFSSSGSDGSTRNPK